MIIFKSTFNCL